MDKAITLSLTLTDLIAFYRKVSYLDEYNEDGTPVRRTFSNESYCDYRRLSKVTKAAEKPLIEYRTRLIDKLRAEVEADETVAEEDRAKELDTRFIKWVEQDPKFNELLFDTKYEFKLEEKAFNLYKKIFAKSKFTDKDVHIDQLIDLFLLEFQAAPSEFETETKADKVVGADGESLPDDEVEEETKDIPVGDVKEPNTKDDGRSV